jgi:hypothetical protein
MTFATRGPSIATAALALVVAACGATGSSAAPSAAPTTALEPTASLPATTVPTSSVEPSTVPASVPATSPPASASAACAVVPSAGQLPSDRLIDVKVSRSSDGDHLTFVFGNPSLPGPPAPPEGSLAVAKPPFTLAASGAPIVVTGQHVVQIRFTGMSLSNDAGEETYAGPHGIEEPDLPALRHAVLYDYSEGVVGWYVGYDGPGCVTLARDGTNVVVTVAHG